MPVEFRLKTLLIAASALAVQACSDLSGSPAAASSSPTLSKAATCRKLVRHRLDGDGHMFTAQVADRADALEACSGYAAMDNANPEGFERLAVIYSSPAGGAAIAPADALAAIENMRRAEARGSTYASYVLTLWALDGVAGVEDLTANVDEQKRKALAALAAKVDQGSTSAKMLYIDLLIRTKDGGFADSDELEASGARRLLAEVASVNEQLPLAYHQYLADQNACRKFSTSEADRNKPKPPAYNFPACQMLLETGAEAGDASAAFYAGLVHAEIAKAIYEAKRGDWREMTQSHLDRSKKYLLVARQGSDNLTSTAAANLLTRLDGVSLSEASPGAEVAGLVLAGLFALAVASDGEPASVDSGSSNGWRESFCRSIEADVVSGVGGERARMDALGAGC